MRPLLTRFGHEIHHRKDRELHDMEQVVSRMTPGVPYTHDHADDTEYRFVVRQHGGEEHLSRHFPGLHGLLTRARTPRPRTRMLAAGGAAAERAASRAVAAGPLTLTEVLHAGDPVPPEWTADMMVVGASYDGVETDGKFSVSAQGIFTDPGGNYSTSPVLEIFDRSTGATLAKEIVPTEYLTGDFVSVMAWGLADYPDDELDAIWTVTWFPDDADDPVTKSIRAPLAEYCPVATPSVSDPVTRFQGRDFIKIALGRDAHQVSDCDYYYPTVSGEKRPVTVVGKAQYAEGAVISPLSSDSFRGTMRLWRRAGGGGGGADPVIKPAEMMKYISVGGNTVVWNFVPAVFDGAKWDQGETIDFTLEIPLLVTPPGAAAPVKSTVSVTSAPRAVDTLCRKKILPLRFVWGCLAAGTEVWMEDGSLRPIETVREGDRVRAGAGGRVLTVDETTVGDERKPCFRIRTACGREVLATADHPFPTPQEVKPARALKPGDEVWTTDGLSPVVSVEAEAYGGYVYNLRLGRGVAEMEGLTDDNRTHFAGGVLVGDAAMQGALNAAAARGPSREEILARLPAELVPDFLNTERLRRGEPLLVLG
ncbi:MAG TPA: Hint domain-containing protein [Longimicrobium sp.]|nr:Hint domain-containing protein [Longimicrobium sp.]